MLVCHPPRFAAGNRTCHSGPKLVRHSGKPGRRPIPYTSDAVARLRHVHQQRGALLDDGSEHAVSALQAATALAAQHSSRLFLYPQVSATACVEASSQHGVNPYAASPGSVGGSLGRDLSPNTSSSVMDVSLAEGRVSWP